MADLGLTTFNKLYPMMIRKYNDLIIDQNATEAEKINQIIQKLNALGKLSNDVVRDWNTVYGWAMNDGLTTDVSNKIEQMNANGELNSILTSLFNSEIGDLTTLQTVDKSNVVSAINDNVASLAQNTSRLSNLQVDVKIDFGAKGDGTTDDTTAFQNAINAVSTAGGGTVWIPPSSTKYLLNSSITLKNGVILKSAGGSRGAGGATLKAGHTGIMFSDPSSGYCASAFIGVNFEGKTSPSVSTLNAININSLTRIVSCGFNFFSQSAVVLNGTAIASTIQDIICTNCVYDRTVTSPTGGVHVLGTDHYLFNIEANVQSGHTDVSTNGNAVSLYIGGSNHFVTDCIGEFGEVGIYLAGSKCRLKGCRADRNMGHGYVVTGSNNIFTNCHAMEDGTATTNTYTAFQVQSNLNTFVACSYGNQGTSIVKYGFDDWASSATQKNEYFGCSVLGSVGTAKYNSSSFLGSGFSFGNAWYRITSGATVDVSGINNLNLDYSTPTTITGFTGGVNGQHLKIIGTTNVTIQINSNIKTNTGFNKTLAGYNKIYSFTNFNGIWYEHDSSDNSNGWGAVTVNAGSTTYAVTGLTEPGTSYIISVTPYWNTTFWITNKTTSGFTVNFGTAPASNSTFDVSIRK